MPFMTMLAIQASGTDVEALGLPLLPTVGAITVN